MRRFHSYGPVNCRDHFCVPRAELVEACYRHLVGDPDEGGHYFTVWGPRQTGKTWLVRQVRKEVEKRLGDKLMVGCLSVQGVIMEKDDPDEVFFMQLPRVIRDGLDIEPDAPETWGDWVDWFSTKKGLFRKPLVLFIDEFDSLPPGVIDRLVTLFRDMYLKRESYVLHGLALVGVRAVLGVDSPRGSPFNVQRSLHVPNLTGEEVRELFRQYAEESGQRVEPPVVDGVFEVTRGQPGLVGWLGELLTEKYNPGLDRAVGPEDWKRAYAGALRSEWNNSVLNLVKKARGKYADRVLELFGRSDLPFRIWTDWCSYLYLNGIIDKTTVPDEQRNPETVCRFSSPFVQSCIFDAFAADLAGDRLPVLALDPLDTLDDVFDKPEPDVPALLERYRGYLARLKAKNIDPWKGQPRREDLHPTEYVGHFHLYSWLCNAVGRRCIVSPEFPAGNGRVDLHLRCGEKRGVIEVKSFRDRSELERSKLQARGYAERLGLSRVAVAVFVPVEDETVLEALSTREVLDGIEVTVTAVAWT